MKKKIGGVALVAAVLGSALLLTTAAMAKGPTKAANGGNHGNSMSHTASSFQNNSSEETGGNSQGNTVMSQKQAATKNGATGDDSARGIPAGKDGHSDFVEAAINALSDEDKQTLNAYIEAYENAVAAQQEAIEPGTGGNNLSSYRKTTQNAAKKLLGAAKETDVNLGLKLGNFMAAPEAFGKQYGTADLESVIDSLSDEDQEALKSYIDVYQSAVDAEQEAIAGAKEGDDLSSYREAVKNAADALLDAAKEADIDLDLAMGNFMSDYCKQYAAADVETAIDALSAENAATLSSYIDAYETAVEAQKEAIAGAEEGDDLSSYREAVQDAAEALLNAAEEADIDLDLPVWDFISDYCRPCASADVEMAIDALSDEDTAALSSYIDAYETAVEAEQDAIDSAEEGDDLSSYRQAVCEALKALCDAADEADIALVTANSAE